MKCNRSQLKMSDLLNRIKDQLSKFENKRNLLVSELQKEFPQLLKPLFEQSKRIESIGWTQYTPYFNDGEECLFSVNIVDIDELFINGNRVWDLEDEDNWIIATIGYPSVPNPNFDSDEYRILCQINKILNDIPEDFYKDLFGDHRQVTIYKDGRIQVDEWDHD